MQYRREIPVAWRALAVLCYCADLFGLGVLVPFAVWTVYPRSFFLRAHALQAGLIQAIGLVVVGILRALDLFFIYESDSFTIAYSQFLGDLFAKVPLLTGQLLFFLAGLFLVSALRLITRQGGAAWTRRQGAFRPVRKSPGDAGPLLAFLAISLTVFVLNNQAIWGPAAPAEGQGGTFGASLFKVYRDPLRLFPGFLVTLWCVFLAGFAVRGQILWLRTGRRLFVRFTKDARARGECRLRAARQRALLLPGWGHFFLGRRVSGVAAFCCALLLAFYLVISGGLVYGERVQNIPGLNANFTWYFLSNLGLRSQVPDAQFKNLLGQPIIFAGLVLSLALTYAYSFRAAGQIYLERGRAAFLAQTAPSLLLHLTPLAMVLVIPVSFEIARRPSQPPPGEIEPIPIVPEFFEKPANKFELNGGAYSGNEAPEYFPGPAGETPRRGPLENAPDRPDAPDRQGPLVEKKPPGVGGRPGKRQDLTYSNYISAKIRGPQSGDYWDRVPDPYAAVFEYKIASTGRVFDVRILEPSGHPQADLLTVSVIEAMGVLLPPPGGTTVVVTELFWNTSYADEGLPTELKRNLSKAFDGRVIEPY